VITGRIPDGVVRTRCWSSLVEAADDGCGLENHGATSAIAEIEFSGDKDQRKGVVRNQNNLNNQKIIANNKKWTRSSELFLKKMTRTPGPCWLLRTIIWPSSLLRLLLVDMGRRAFALQAPLQTRFGSNN
jgi:hypothetical protein